MRLIRLKSFLHLPLQKRNERLREAPIAQMDRASDYESAGRVFESPWARHEPHRVRGCRAPYMVHGAISNIPKVHGSPELHVVQDATINWTTP